MGGSRVADPGRIHRHRYIIEDPIRFACLCATAVLFFLPRAPFALTLLVVAVTQLSAVAMAARAMEQGWSSRWGRGVHASVFASSLAMDFVNLAACTLVGALLLVRQFNGPEVLKPLAILAAAVCFLPDVRLCRWLLAGEPAEASEQLRHGYFWRDPVMLGALLTAAMACVLDAVSLRFVMLSLAFLQVNTLLVIVDKYLPEIETSRFGGWKALFLEREGRRLGVCLAPLAIVPLRHFMGDRAAWWAAGLVAAAVLLPDVARLAWAGVRAITNCFRVTPLPHPAGPTTFIVMPVKN